MNNTVPEPATGSASSGDALFFGTSSITSLINDDPGFTFASLNFNAGASAFTIGGNSFALTGNIVNSSKNTQTINLPLTIATPTFNTGPGGGNLVLNGNVSATAGTGGTITTGTTGGALFLNGANTFTGVSTTVNTITTTTGLFLNSNTTVVFGSNTAACTGAIDFNTLGGIIAASSGGVTLANGFITNNTNGTFAAGGNITVNGLFQFGGSNFITVNNNTTLAGGIDIRDGTSVGARAAGFNGSGNLTISGVIANGSTNSAGTLLYAGTGSLTLSSANTYSGGTTLLGGTTTLDYTNNAGTKISAAGSGGTLSIGGGTLNLNGGSATETVVGTTLLAGASGINRTNGSTTLINLNAITRNAGSTLALGGGIVTTSTGTANTLLISFAGVVGVVGGNDWAAKDAANSTVVGLSTVNTYTPNTATGFTAGANTDVTSNVTLGASAATSTLRFNTAAAATVDLGTNTLNLTQSGILVTPAVGNNLTTITDGTLTGLTNNTTGASGLNVFQNNTAAGLTIGAVTGGGIVRCHAGDKRHRLGNGTMLIDFTGLPDNSIIWQ